MPAGTYDISIAQNESLDRLFTWKDEHGSILDITGYTFRAQVRDRNNTLITALNTSVANATGGQFRVFLDPASTATLPPGGYSWDLFATSATGYAQRLIAGDFEVRRPVTQ